jgi:anthranilate phosphoribosyltransferase
MSDLKEFIEKAVDGPLSRTDAESAFNVIMGGKATPSQIGGFLMTLRTRGESVDEYAAAAAVMRAKCVPVNAPVGAMDIVGTGGDGKNTLNISTATAFVVAGAGVVVAKHGNKNLSSKSGTADVQSQMGINVMVGPDVVEQALREAGIGFMMAPMHHPAVRFVMPSRQELGTRTIFNILGPLTNPAAPPFNLIGAFSVPMAKLMAESLAGMPHVQRAFVIHGEPGWDEATPVGEFTLFDVRPGEVIEEHRDPIDFGIPRCTPEDLAGGDAGFNASALEAVLTCNDRGPHREALVLGAGLVLELTGRVSAMRDGIAQARAALDAGDAAQVLEKLRAFNNPS